MVYAIYEEGDTPMNHAPSLDSLEARLSHARQQFVALLRIGEQISGISLNSWQLERAVKNMLEKKNEWLPTVPAFRDGGEIRHGIRGPWHDRVVAQFEI